MADLRYCTDYHATYESFEVHCPHCGVFNVVPRSAAPTACNLIALRKAVCISCQETFGINGDLVSPPYAFLLDDAASFLRKRRYMNVVLNSAQAFEAFCSLYLVVELAYKPFWRESSRPMVQKLNEVLNLLSTQTERYTFAPMRSIVLHLLLDGVKPASLTEAKTVIGQLDVLGKKAISVEEVEALRDPVLRELLRRMRAANVDRLRNRVVHKEAYRPTHDEASQCLESARSTLLPLGEHLGLVTDEPNWYRSTA
jgi:hypothetical protein